MAVKTLQQLRADIANESQKVDDGSITPTDVFGIDRDVVDSLYQILTTEYQPALQGDEPQNITVDQNKKRIKLAQTLRNILNITGEAGDESVLKLFCNADYQRDPELSISKALLALRALEIRLKTKNIDRLVLDSTGVSLNAAGGNPILYATANEINIFDANSGNPLITRNNDGNLSLFYKKNGSISPLLSAQSGDVTLYNNTNHAPILSTTETIATIYNHNGNPVMQSRTTANGISFEILRDNLKPLAVYNPATNTFTIYGNNKTGGVCKLVEQTSNTSCSYYGITDTEIFRHERNGADYGFQVNNSFAKAVYNSVVFKGTTAAWNALASGDKDKYESVILID